MGRIGPLLVLLFSALILGAMFLPYAKGFDGNSNFWVLASGADIALAAAAVLALGAAIGAVAAKAGALRTLAALFGGLTCGVIWAYTSNSLKHTEGTKAGFWVLSVLGILILLSAIVTALTPAERATAGAAAGPGPQPFTPPPSPARPAPAAPAAHPAGWYRDPAGGSAERYWDGTRWTDQFRPPAS